MTDDAVRFLAAVLAAVPVRIAAVLAIRGAAALLDWHARRRRCCLPVARVVSLRGARP